jgi:hypothetical protein
VLQHNMQLQAAVRAVTAAAAVMPRAGGSHGVVMQAALALEVALPPLLSQLAAVATSRSPALVACAWGASLASQQPRVYISVGQTATAKVAAQTRLAVAALATTNSSSSRAQHSWEGCSGLQQQAAAPWLKAQEQARL